MRVGELSHVCDAKAHGRMIGQEETQKAKPQATKATSMERPEGVVMDGGQGGWVFRACRKVIL